MRLYPGAALMASLLFCPSAGVIGAENDPALSTVNGRVLERGTRRPVASAVVEIVPGREPVYTDRAGLFTVDSVPAGVHAASVAAIGYRVFRQDISVTRSVEGVVFRLEPEGGLLQEVEVVARAREGTARQQVISGGELRQVPATAGDPLRAVTALPGINPGSDIDSNLYVRGSGPNDSALYADGVPAGYPYHYQGLASTFQTGTVKDLRFYSGGFPARYGDRMGGIFDITTQRASPDRITGNLGFSAIMSGATVEAPLPAAGATGIFAFRQGYGDLVMPRHAKDVAVPRFSDYLARVDLPESSGARVRLEAFGAEDAAKAMVRRSTSDLVGSFKWHHAFHVGALTWDQRWDDSLETTVMASANTTENELDLGQNYYFDVKPSGMFGRAEARKSAGRHMFTAGTECAYTEYLMDVFFARLPMEGQGAYNWTSLSKLRLSGRMYGTNGGAYLSDRVRVAGPLEVEAGGRLDTYSLTDAFRASPRVSARLPLTPEARVFGAWGLYNQSPQPMELMPIWGNPRLLPNRAWHSIVGIEKDLGSWTASVEAYDKRFEDLVTPDAESV